MYNICTQTEKNRRCLKLSNRFSTGFRRRQVAILQGEQDKLDDENVFCEEVIKHSKEDEKWKKVETFCGEDKWEFNILKIPVDTLYKLW